MLLERNNVGAHLRKDWIVREQETRGRQDFTTTWIIIRYNANSKRTVAPNAELDTYNIVNSFVQKT